MFCVGEGWLLSLLIPYMVSSSGPQSFILEIGLIVSRLNLALGKNK